MCLQDVLVFQEYIQDGIDWAKVDFEDNQDCLNLFEKVQSNSLECFICAFYLFLWIVVLEIETCTSIVILLFRACWIYLDMIIKLMFLFLTA
jgi:hypothetical protein